jgi:type III restriction enzyme
VSYNSRYKKQDQPLSVLKPFYTATQSEPEKAFIELLNASKSVKWWYKNGESEIKYLAILRSDDRAFYPDFIIQLKNGTTAIFETKSGFTAGEDAKERAESLQRYIKKQNKVGKKIVGGIAINENGTWRYNDNEKYKYNPDDLSDWKVLNMNIL